MKAETIWAITDGKAGMVKQARGLAHAIAREAGGDVVEKVIVPCAPWAILPAGLWPWGVSGIGPGSDDLSAPWPKIIVSCGRHAIGPAVWIKRQNDG
ncbi:MAG: ELM1/GtrOC1 family putative glycosyltransferase, partial [Pseudomonadota bacterium]|nr:ELM1/GtrOC1 family putative glycosyltransferase [Pseudomonadota bacterium]